MALSALYLYCPSLGPTDETVTEQILFHVAAHPSPEDQTDKLLEVGLAQGIVEFAKAFSPHSSTRVINTMRNRMVPINVESDWWFLLKNQVVEPIHQGKHHDYYEGAGLSISINAVRTAYQAFATEFESFEIVYRSNGRKYFMAIVEDWWKRWYKEYSRITIKSSLDAIPGIKMASTNDACVASMQFFELLREAKTNYPKHIIDLVVVTLEGNVLSGNYVVRSLFPGGLSFDNSTPALPYVTSDEAQRITSWLSCLAVFTSNNFPLSSNFEKPLSEKELNIDGEIISDIESASTWNTLLKASGSWMNASIDMISLRGLSKGHRDSKQVAAADQKFLVPERGSYLHGVLQGPVKQHQVLPLKNDDFYSSPKYIYSFASIQSRFTENTLSSSFCDKNDSSIKKGCQRLKVIVYKNARYYTAILLKDQEETHRDGPYYSLPFYHSFSANFDSIVHEINMSDAVKSVRRSTYYLLKVKASLIYSNLPSVSTIPCDKITTGNNEIDGYVHLHNYIIHLLDAINDNPDDVVIYLTRGWWVVYIARLENKLTLGNAESHVLGIYVQRAQSLTSAQEANYKNVLANALTALGKEYSLVAGKSRSVPIIKRTPR